MPFTNPPVRRSFASISLDLDNQWAYMKTHGDEDWRSFPSYLDLVVPRILELLARHKLRATFFVVGQDAALAKNHSALRSIVDGGHEIANHSFHHEPWLHLYTRDEVDAEIEAAEEAITAATGIRPRGFRGPGFSISKTVLQTLKTRDYLYDASTFPTFLGPLARAYYFFNASLSKQEREKRKHLFGGVSDGLRSLRPYEWQLDDGNLLEIPVTTMPLVRAPFHFSYVMFLACQSRELALTYFRSALRLCRLRGIEPSLLLHPLDYLGGDDVAALKFFPGMKLSGREKVALADQLFSEYVASFEVLTMEEYVGKIRLQGPPPRRQPNFRQAQLLAR